MQKTYTQAFDLVVVGAGNGGLVTATTAAQQGMKVIMFERHNLPGGFASSFVRGRFEFESALHEPAGLGTPEHWGDLGELFQRLEANVKWHPVPDFAFRVHIGKGEDAGLDVRMPFGIDAFVEKMEELVPGSRASTRKFFDLGAEFMAAYNYMAATKGNVDKNVMTKEYGSFMRAAPYDALTVMKKLGMPHKAIVIMSAYWCYLGVELERIGASGFIPMCYKFVDQGVLIPEDRSFEMSSAIINTFYKYGGICEFNTTVTKVLVENGRVVGVETDMGDVIKTGHVVVNASPHYVYNQLVFPKNAVPEIAHKEVNSHILGPAGTVLYLGLNKSAEELGIEDYSIFIYDDSDTKVMHRSMSSKDMPSMSADICINLANPKASPPGTCILFLTCLYQPFTWYDVKDQDYFELKNKLAGAIIDHYEKNTGISIRPYIEELELAAPPTFSRYANAYDGVIYAYESEGWDSLISRIMTFRDEAWISGLRITGSYGPRGLGFSSAYLAGENVGAVVCAEIREERKNG